MANSNTLNYNLVKPQVGGATDNWGSLLNNNFDTIDTTLFDVQTAVGAAAAAASSKVPLNGGNMNGPLVLSEPGSDASPDNQAAAVKYVKDKVAAAQIAAGQGLPLSGGDMKGFITLHANPTSNMHATTKQYADALIKSSFVMNSGANITLGGAPTQDLHAATKAYVDTKAPNINLSNVSQNVVLANGYTITLGKEPSSNSDAATKAYVDGKIPTGMASTTATSTQSFSGNIQAPTITATVDFVLSSDARMKKDIRTIENAVSLVNRMRGVHYRMKATENANIGVIAQEMRDVFPEVVREDEDGMLSVAYQNLVGVLIEAVKELSGRIEKLEAR